MEQTSQTDILEHVHASTKPQTGNTEQEAQITTNITEFYISLDFDFFTLYFFFAEENFRVQW